MAFAFLEQWPEAERCFRKGQNKAPSDKRFPLELAGIAFKRGNRSETRGLVRRALGWIQTNGKDLRSGGNTFIFDTLNR